MMNRLNRFLFLALVVVLAALALMRVDHSRPNFQVVFGNDMTYSPAYGAYSANSNFANGRTIQEPITGTLARSESRFDFLATPEDALRAGEQLISPYAKGVSENTAAADRGAIVFQTFCTSCHGGDANGNGPVAQRGFPPPPSLLTGKSRDMKDGQLFHILTLGQNNMPPFAVQLPPSRRWDVIAYIRRLQQSATPPQPTTPLVISTTPVPPSTTVPPTAESTTPTAKEPNGEPKQ